jgi:hypothetical protein
VYVNVEGQVAAIGVQRRHHSWQGRMLATARAHCSQRRPSSGLRDYREQLPALKEEGPQFGRDRKRQVAMTHIEQAAPRAFRGLGSPGSAARQAEAAFAGEADRMRGPALLAAVTDEAILRRAATQRFADRIPSRLGNRSRQMPLQQRLDTGPVVGQDRVQQAWR